MNGLRSCVILNGHPSEYILHAKRAVFLASSIPEWGRPSNRMSTNRKASPKFLALLLYHDWTFFKQRIRKRIRIKNIKRYFLPDTRLANPSIDWNSLAALDAFGGTPAVSKLQSPSRTKSRILHSQECWLDLFWATPVDVWQWFAEASRGIASALCQVDCWNRHGTGWFRLIVCKTHWSEPPRWVGRTRGIRRGFFHSENQLKLQGILNRIKCYFDWPNSINLFTYLPMISGFFNVFIGQQVALKSTTIPNCRCCWCLTVASVVHGAWTLIVSRRPSDLKGYKMIEFRTCGLILQSPIYINK